VLRLLAIIVLPPASPLDVAASEPVIVAAAPVPPPAPAQPALTPTRGSVSTVEDSVWYGWEILITDTAAWAVLLAGYWQPALTVMTFGGPTVHWANGENGRGFASLGLRAGLTTGLGLLGYELAGAPSKCPEDSCMGAGLATMVGAAVGMLIAQLVDATTMAYRPAVSAPTGPAKPAFALAPTLTPLKTGGMLGVVAVF
jgi:hypothetical protein